MLSLIKSHDYSSLNELLEGTGLNYEVAKRPLYVRDENGNITIVPGRVGLYNKSNGRFIEIVSNSYNVIQNKEAFSILEDFKNDLKFCSGGNTLNFKKVWIQTEIKRDFKIDGEDYKYYLFIVHSFDRTTGLILCLTPMRVSCSNAIIFAINKSVFRTSIRHSINYEHKINEFKKYFYEFINFPIKEGIERLKAVYIDENKARKVLENLFKRKETESLSDKILKVDFREDERENKKKMSKIIEEKIETVINIFKVKDDLQNMGNNGWRLYNAISDYISNEVPKKQLNKKGRISDNYVIDFVTGHSKLLEAEKEILKVA